MNKQKSVLPELSLKYTHGTFTKQKVISSQQVYDVLLPLYDPDTIEYIETGMNLLQKTGQKVKLHF